VGTVQEPTAGGEGPTRAGDYGDGGASLDEGRSAGIGLADDAGMYDRAPRRLGALRRHIEPHIGSRGGKGSVTGDRLQRGEDVSLVVEARGVPVVEMKGLTGLDDRSGEHQSQDRGHGRAGDSARRGAVSAARHDG
jgi:hypothetical protein